MYSRRLLTTSMLNGLDCSDLLQSYCITHFPGNPTGESMSMSNGDIESSGAAFVHQSRPRTLHCMSNARICAVSTLLR